jgi:ABC-type dipeptide/oligopeptide/nickel transport system ATPase component
VAGPEADTFHVVEHVPARAVERLRGNQQLRFLRPDHGSLYSAFMSHVRPATDNLESAERSRWRWKWSERAMEDVRVHALAMVFQEPMTALDPVFTVGEQIAGTVRRRDGAGAAQARERAALLLARVGIPDPGRQLAQYPHELSGGMRRRLMIALALACRPKLLISDEPTTALDATVQAQVLRLLADLQAENEMAMMLVTHDLGVIAQTARPARVMYAGQMVEQAMVADLFDAPAPSV